MRVADIMEMTVTEFEGWFIFDKLMREGT